MAEDMNIIESVRKLFAGRPTVESLESAVAELERAQDAAQAKSAEAWKGHRARTLEFVSMVDQTAADRSRAKCEEADRRTQDLTAALEDARTRLEGARRARSASDSASAWEATERLLSARSEAMARLQALLVEVAAEHRRLLALSEDAWQSLPTRPTSRPPTFAPGDLSARLQLFLYGASGGRLGSGSNAYVASQRPDLVTQGHDATLMLMAPRPVVLPEAEV